MLATSRLMLKSAAVQTRHCKCRLHRLRCLQSYFTWKNDVRLYSAESTEPLPMPNEGTEKFYPPKLQKIVEDISQLTLIEVADLNELLKKTLKIADAPVMAVGAVAGAPAGGAAPQEAEEEEEEAVQTATKSTFAVKLTGSDPDKKIEAEEEEEEAVQTATKSTFAVKLTGFDPDKKIALIKEIKNLIPGTNLVQAKKFVEAAPANVGSNLTKTEAEELVTAIENAGGKAEMD